MASAVNVGSINLPKMMRQLSHRTSQVRELVFIRDAVYDKDYAKFRKDDSGQAELSGPPVNFGYESNSTTASSFNKTQDRGTVTHRYVSTPEIVLPGLKMLQSPIVSRSGKLERGGHRVSGACTFYAPSLDYIIALDNFKDAKAFAELESYDKLIDIERIIYHPVNMSWTGTGAHQFTTPTFADATAGYEIDRVRFRIRSSAPAGEHELDAFTIAGTINGNATELSWYTVGSRGSPLDSEWTYVDLPLRVKDDDITSVYKDGVRMEYLANQENENDFDINKLYGDSNNELTSLFFDVGEYNISGSYTIEIENLYLYKEAEWRIEAIKDYRDEYMQISAARIRGERASRRRSYG